MRHLKTKQNKKKIVQKWSYDKMNLFYYKMIQCREVFYFFSDLSTVFK